MNVKIKKLFELADDLQTILFGSPFVNLNYTEIYPTKTHVNGIETNVFTIRAKTFYEIELTHIPPNVDFILDPILSASGIIYNFNPLTKQLFLYNCTENVIFIDKDAVIGDIND